jgi:hypothetical protein
MGVTVSAAAKHALARTAEWMADTNNPAAQQAMLAAIWALVRPYLSQAPEHLPPGLRFQVTSGLIAPSPADPPSALGMYVPSQHSVHVVHPDVLRLFGFLVDLSKVFVIIIGHELVHVWQDLHQQALLDRIEVSFSRNRMVDERCFMEAHATMVMTSVANQNGLWLQNETGLALLRFKDTGRDVATVCYYTLSKKYAAVLRAWADLDTAATSRWVLRYSNDPWRPETIVALAPPIGTKFHAKPLPPPGASSTRAAAMVMARRELAGVPLADPTTPKEKRQAAYYAARREDFLAKLSKTSEGLRK